MRPRRHAALLRVVSVLGPLLVTVGGCIGPERGSESLILGTIMGLAGLLLAVGLLYHFRG